MDMITQGGIAALTVLWLLSYVGFRKVLGYAFLVDVFVTGTFILMFSGSYAGMMTGVIAGLLVSMFLRIGSLVIRPQRLTVRRRKSRILPSVIWRYTR
jgi:hypothetical protein